MYIYIYIYVYICIYLVLFANAESVFLPFAIEGPILLENVKKTIHENVKKTFWADCKRKKNVESVVFAFAPCKAQT